MDLKISRGSNVDLSAVNEDLEIEDDAIIRCTGDGANLVVNGDIECRGRVGFTGNVQCEDFEGRDDSISIEGSLRCRELRIEHNADLSVAKDIQAYEVEVDNSLRVGGKIEAREIEVGGRFETKDVKADSVSVGGVFDAHGDVDVEEIEVGGKLEIEGKVTSRELSVGGKATLGGGGIVSQEIEVGGVLTVDAPIEYGSIDVGGTAKLKGNAKGREIDVGGTFEVEGDLDFTDMDVGGIARIKGNATGVSIDLGGRLSIENALRLRGELDIGGTIEVGGDAEAGDVEIGGDFRAASLKARNLEIGGGAHADKGIFAKEDVRLGHRSRVEGWVRAGKQIEIDSRSEVDSVSAPRVIIDDRSRARNIYCDSAEIGDRVEVSGEVLYTRSIETGDDVRFAKQPEKVSQIPPEKSWIEPSSSASVETK
jgi:cytoskeletal protein CcmA (bactofilin family)